MKLQPPPSFDKLYWSRIGFAVIAGILAEVLTGSDWTSGVSIGILFYLISYYVARFMWYRGMGREGQGKLYSTGIGGFIMIFLFTWMLLFTLQAVGYSL
jgi:hypothetical protein